VPFFAFLSDRTVPTTSDGCFIPVDLSDVALQNYMELESQTSLVKTNWVEAKKYRDVYIASVSYRMYTLSTRIIDLLRFVENIYVLKYVYRKGVDYQQLVELSPIFSYNVEEDSTFIKVTKTSDTTTYRTNFKSICSKLDMTTYINNQILGEYSIPYENLIDFFESEVLNHD